MMQNQNELEVEKPRRMRTSKPKVKTGCNNCKYVHLHILIKRGTGGEMKETAP